VRFAALFAVLLAVSCAPELPKLPTPPSFILCLSDDQGWGDAAYQGHPRLRTPHLDALARRGVRFDRFYATPMCTPTRAGLLTGRHPARFGIVTTALESLPVQATTIAEVLGERGWATGHFGKWHLGTLSATRSDRRAQSLRRVENYSPPWGHGFEVCFSTEASVPTWDPLVDPETGGEFGTLYWEGPDRPVTENLGGDDSRLIVDRADAFIRRSVAEGRPFLALVWFHAPHRPVVAGPDWVRVYGDATKGETDYWGALSAMDGQIGRLRRTLEELGIRDDTMLFFCSDNGPALNERRFVSAGSAGPFRGGKGGLHEGGVRVPALLDWPRRSGGIVSDATSFLDVVPTVLAAAGIDRAPGLPPLDGVDLLAAPEGIIPARPWPIAFRTRQQSALLGGRHKLISDRTNDTLTLYDLVEDPYETRDLVTERPGVVQELEARLDEWLISCLQSRQR
jgi:arylsulfatase A-like enzyme